jgi:succinate-semialdehyde dehydrogenase/glutarate-semialdehyde dehydrogenase
VTLGGDDGLFRREETFGPLIPVFPFDSEDEVLDKANDSAFGLASYVFTRDLTRAVAVGEQLQFGMVGINRGIMADPAAPFGGIKASGIGREAGQDGIHEFLESKYMAVTVQDTKELL